MTPAIDYTHIIQSRAANRSPMSMPDSLHINCVSHITFIIPSILL